MDKGDINPTRPNRLDSTSQVTGYSAQSQATSGADCWGQSIPSTGYDRYGNMTCVTNDQTNGPCPNFTFNTSNHITTSGYTYDAAGKLTSDGVNTYQWDAECLGSA